MQKCRNLHIVHFFVCTVLLLVNGEAQSAGIQTDDIIQNVTDSINGAQEQKDHNDTNKQQKKTAPVSVKNSKKNEPSKKQSSNNGSHIARKPVAEKKSFMRFLGEKIKSVREYLTEKTESVSKGKAAVASFFALIVAALYMKNTGIISPQVALTGGPAITPPPAITSPKTEQGAASIVIVDEGNSAPLVTSDFIGTLPSKVKYFTDALNHPEKYTSFNISRSDKLLLLGETRAGKRKIIEKIIEETNIKTKRFDGAELEAMHMRDQHSFDKASYQLFVDSAQQLSAKKNEHIAVIVDKIHDISPIILRQFLSSYRRYSEKKNNISLIMTAENVSDEVKNIFVSEQFSIARIKIATEEERLKSITTFAKQYNYKDIDDNCIQQLVRGTFGMHIGTIKDLFEKSAKKAALQNLSHTPTEFILHDLQALIQNKQKENLHRSFPSVTFNNIIGTIPEACRRVVDQFRNIALYNDQKIPPTRALLFEGPTGTGKSFTAEAIAGELGDVAYFYVPASHLTNKYIGGGSELMRQLLERAKQAARESYRKLAIIFIDEIDVIASKRSDETPATTSPGASEHNNSIAQLLCILDGKKSKKEKDKDINILIIGATNYPEHLDSALLRPGRFDVRVKMEKPTEEDRKKLVMYYMNHNVPYDESITVDDYTKLVDNLTQAEINGIHNDATRRALYNRKNDQTSIVISKSELEESVKVIKENSEKANNKKLVDELKKRSPARY